MLESEEKQGIFWLLQAVRWQNVRNMREIQYELWFFQHPENQAEDGWVRYGTKLKHVFHRIGMISILGLTNKITILEMSQSGQLYRGSF